MLITSIIMIIHVNLHSQSDANIIKNVMKTSTENTVTGFTGSQHSHESKPSHMLNKKEKSTEHETLVYFA